MCNKHPVGSRLRIHLMVLCPASSSHPSHEDFQLAVCFPVEVTVIASTLWNTSLVKEESTLHFVEAWEEKGWQLNKNPKSPQKCWHTRDPRVYKPNLYGWKLRNEFNDHLQKAWFKSCQSSKHSNSHCLLGNARFLLPKDNFSAVHALFTRSLPR